MANFLAEFYESSALIPIDRVMAKLAEEIDPKKISDFLARVEKMRKIDTENAVRKDYWATLAVRTSRLLGEMIIEGQKNGTIASKGKPKTKMPHDGPFTKPLKLTDLRIERHHAQNAKNLAAVPESVVEGYISKQKESHQEITMVGAIRAAKPKKPKRKPAAKPKSDEKDDAGGYEPHEAAKPLEKLRATLSKAARDYGDVKLILGEPAPVKAIFAGIDAATIALERYRRQLKKQTA